MDSFLKMRSVQILCAITFHFDVLRLVFLGDVLRSLAEFPTRSLDVFILTNTEDEDELRMLEHLCQVTLPGAFVSIQSERDLETRFELTWRHKRLIVEQFLAPGNDYTHFIYLEGDIRLSIVNFCYFIEAREKLRDFGLIPAFVRVEYGDHLNSFTCSDSFWPIYVPVQPKIVLEDDVYLNMPNPYNPLYILDRELALEYIGSRSFDRERSRDVSSWGIAERAAMGLCLENVPAGFNSRYVVPVSRKTCMAYPQALISHLPNNYANNPRSPLAKVTLDNLFVGAQEIGDDGLWLAVDVDDHGLQAVDFATNEHLDSRLPSSPLPPRTPPPISSDLHQFYLVTHHDTILYFDCKSKFLRHGPYGTVPLNVVIELSGRLGRLRIKDCNDIAIGQPSVEPADLARLFRLTDSDIAFDIETYAEGTVSLRLDGSHLGADQGGAISMKSWCREWEQFTLVKSQLIEGLGFLRGRTWISHADRRLVSLAAQPIEFRRTRPPPEASALAATLAPSAIEIRRDIAFGPARVRLTDKGCSFMIERSSCVPMSVRISDATGTEFVFLIFEPLIHYRLKGDQAQYEMLRASLDCLEQGTEYRGHIAVTCDRTRDQLLPFIPDIFRNRLLVFSASDHGDVRLRSWHRELYRPIYNCEVHHRFDNDLVTELVDLAINSR
jgi:hypothetical protein